MKILIIVDLQNDFCPGGALPVPDGDKIVPVLNALMEKGGFDLVVATKDFHPAGHLSFASSHLGRQPFEVIKIGALTQTLWPEHCVQGTFGADLHPDLNQSKIAKIINKGSDPKIDSYSAFYDNARIKETELRSYIDASCVSQGVKKQAVEIIIGGLALDYCVKATALDAVSLGYRTSIVLDATRSVNITPGDDLRTLRQLRQAGVEIIESRMLLPSERLQKLSQEIQISA